MKGMHINLWLTKRQQDICLQNKCHIPSGEVQQYNKGSCKKEINNKKIAFRKVFDLTLSTSTSVPNQRVTMIQRGSSLHCPPVTFQPARDLCSCLLCSSATLYYCFTFQLLFCYAIGNLVLLIMVITVKPSISVFRCFFYTSSMEKTVC